MKNTLRENMRRFGTKNLSEQHLGGLGMRKNTIDISTMSGAEVHWLIHDLVEDNPDRAAEVVDEIAKTLKPGQDVSLLQTYLDSAKWHTSMENIGNHMVNPKNLAITQKFINHMTM